MKKSNKLNEKAIVNNILASLCAPIIIGALLLIVYFIHGVYPFGEKNVSYYDMSQSFIPLYYHTWDVLHGAKNIYFDWNIGMGCTLADVTSSFLFFPSNLFFLFVKRDSILNVMSVFLLIKMMISAFSMSYLSIKKYENKVLCVYAGIAYAACGYILQYYTNIYYLDTVMIFPLLILSLDELINEKKKVPYIILLFLTFLTNPQMVFMVVIYIVFKGWFMINKLEKAKQGKAIADMLLASVAGALLSAFAFVPSILSMAQSVRFGNASSWGYIDIIKTIGCEFPEQKHFMLYAGEMGIGGIVYILLNGKEKIRKYMDSVIMVILLVLPIALDSIDLLWSGGSYMHFPMRFGYMLSFELIILIVSLVNDESSIASTVGVKTGKYLTLFGIVFIPFMAVLLGVLCNKFRIHGIRDLSAYTGYGVVFLIIVVISMLILYSGQKRIIQYVLIVVALIQASCGMFGLIAPEGNFSLECGDGFVISADKAFQEIEQQDELNRLKDRDILLNANYGFILKQSSMGCWMNGASPNIQGQMNRMGYSTNYTRILDGCGTAFTDAMLGVRRLYGLKGMNDALYSNETAVGDGYIYDCNYQLPFGFIMSKEEEGSGFDYQNSLFESVTGVEKRLLEEPTIANITKNIYDAEAGINLYEMQIDVNDRSVLYVYATGESDFLSKYSFVINDKQVMLDAQGSENNVMYAQFFLNGMLEMGTYENETVNFKVLSELDSLDNLYIGLMNVDTLAEGIESANSQNRSIASVEDGKIVMEFESSRSGALFLPIAYYDNYLITVDGEACDYYTMLGEAFVGMDIGSGKHIIEVRYVPEGLTIGIILSILGVLLTGIIIVIKEKESLMNKLNMFLVYLYRCVIGVMIIVLYIMPMVGAVIKVSSVLNKYY